MPPLPKHPSTLARNSRRTPGARILAAVHDVPTPAMPDDRPWHPMTTAWWATIWSSPMAPEYIASDVALGLATLCVDVDHYWRLDDLTRTELDLNQLLAVLRSMTAKAAELRLQGQRFGTSPIDRRRLAWEVDRAEAAVAATVQRRNASKPKTPPAKRTRKAPDPREFLK